MAEDPRAKYGLSCPTGGSFYICGLSDTQFVGCCDHDPCTSDRNGICEDDALHPASFSSTNYIDIPPQSCVEPYDEQNWWTCQNAIPPFLGCCKSNPCNAGCPDDDLIPSRLSDNQTNAEPFLATSSSSATQSPVPAAEETPTALIVGVSVGGLVVLFAGIAAFLWRKRQREKKQAAATYTEDNAAQGQPPVTPSGGDPAMMMGQQYSPYKDSYPSTVHSSPFPYQSSIGMPSPPMSTASTCWSPRDARFAHHSRHTSQLSELSGEDYVHELPPEGSSLQPVPELDGGARPSGDRRRFESPSPGVAYNTPGGSNDNDPNRLYHELDGGNRQHIR